MPKISVFTKRRLRIHATRHSKKHMRVMIGAISRGASFREAHLLALERVGR